MKSIGVVDDNPSALKYMCLLLAKAGFPSIHAHVDPHQALQAFSACPPSVLLIDYRMPGLDGIELLGRLQQAGAVRHTPVAMVSGCADFASIRLSAYQAGVHEVIAKPVRPLEFALMVRNLARLSIDVVLDPADTTFQPLKVPRFNAPRSAVSGVSPHEQSMHCLLEKVAACRDESQGNRSARMACYAATIAHHHGLNLRQQKQLIAAAPLHDIGKIGVPEHVLFKRGELSSSERLQTQRHTLIGFELLRNESSPLLQLAAEIALSHHERWDGAGYPMGLSGEDIPLSGRIVAVADAYDALTSRRLFNPPWRVDSAMSAIRHESGKRFDPKVVRSFEAARDSLRLSRLQFSREEALGGVSDPS
jgi:response regulator RpfG family c-di-GMP phosphodiesterase